MTVFRSIQDKSSFFSWGFRMVSEEALSVEYPCYTGDNSIVYHFQLNYTVLVKSHAKSFGGKWHFCQYMFMTKANQLIYEI